MNAVSRVQVGALLLGQRRERELSGSNYLTAWPAIFDCRNCNDSGIGGILFSYCIAAYPLTYCVHSPACPIQASMIPNSADVQTMSLGHQFQKSAPIALPQTPR